jgi:hypothetical protein
MKTPTPTTPEPAPSVNMEQQTVIMSSHVIIRDAHTKQIILNQRGS